MLLSLCFEELQSHIRVFVQLRDAIEPTAGALRVALFMRSPLRRVHSLEPALPPLETLRRAGVRDAFRPLRDSDGRQVAPQLGKREQVLPGDLLAGGVDEPGRNTSSQPGGSSA